MNLLSLFRRNDSLENIPDLQISRIQSFPVGEQFTKHKLPPEVLVSLLGKLGETTQSGNLYKVVIPKGTKGALIKLADGKKLGTIAHHGKISGQARLVKVSNALSGFYIIDTLLRQYYLGDVSKQLGKIIAGIERSEHRRLDERLSVLQSMLCTIQRLQESMPFSSREELVVTKFVLLEKMEYAYAELQSVEIFLRRERENLVKETGYKHQLFRELELALYAQTVYQSAEESYIFLESILSKKLDTDSEDAKISCLSHFELLNETISARRLSISAIGERGAKILMPIYKFFSLGSTANEKQRKDLDMLQKVIDDFELKGRESIAISSIRKEFLNPNKDTIVLLSESEMMVC